MSSQARTPPSWGKLALSWLIWACCALTLGWALDRSARAASASGGPAGLGIGLLHGALMPMAFPGLLLGHDVEIYAASNTGRSYKLGYTLGVNACGAIFFGLTFRRYSRVRRRLQADRDATSDAPPT